MNDLRLHTVMALAFVTSLAPRAPSPVAPSISTLSPTSAVIGTAATTLTVNGAGFARTSVVRWNGANRPTTYVSANQLKAGITTADLAVVGTAQVAVFTQGGNGGTSNASPFTIGNPVPVLGSITPDSVAYQGAQFTMTVNGSSFVPGATVLRGGALRTTAYMGPTRLLVTMPATDMAAIGPSPITVVNPGPLGGTSAPKTLRVFLAKPTIAGRSPVIITAGYRKGFALRVTGHNFLPTAVVRWNGMDRATTLDGPFVLVASIPDSDVDTAGTARITVRLTAFGAQPVESTPLVVDLVHPPPKITSVAIPNPMRIGAAAATVTITGSGFVPMSVVTLNGRPTGLRYLSDTRLEGPLVAQSPDTAGPGVLSVRNAAPGGGVATHAVTIAELPPVLTSISPQNVFRGGVAFTLTVKGDRFGRTMVVFWNGTPRTTTYVSRTELRAAISATDIARVGSADIKVLDVTSGYTRSLLLSVLDKALVIP